MQLLQGGFRRNRATGIWWQTVTIQNLSSSPIEGPLRLVVENLPTGVVLLQSPGHEVANTGSGRYEVTIPQSKLTALAVGQSYALDLGFQQTGTSGINYTWKVFSLSTGA